MQREASAPLRPRARSFFALALALTCFPTLARADGMDGLVAAAIGAALLLAGGLSIGGSVLTLIAAIAYRRRRQRFDQVFAWSLLVINLLTHAGFALMLGEYALVFVPGLALALAAGWVAWRTEPPLDEQGRARPVGPAVAGSVLGVAALIGLAYGWTALLQARALEAERQAELAAEAALRDPSAPAAERVAALELLSQPGSVCVLDGLDLSGLDLHDLMIDRCSFVGTDLRGADLSQIYAIGADLSQADLRGVKLVEARLEQANLSGLDLRGVDLRGAQLADTDLSHAQLEGARLDGAYLAGCKLGGASVTVEQLVPTTSFWGIEGLAEEVEREVDARQAQARAATAP